MPDLKTIAGDLMLSIICTVSVYAAIDSWVNRRKYAAREQKRKAKGGLH